MFKIFYIQCIIFLFVCNCKHTASVNSGTSKKNSSEITKEPVKIMLPHERIPVIDSHVHLDPNMFALANAMQIFRKNHIAKFAAKSAGAYGTQRFWATVSMKEVLGDQFAFFVNIDWENIDDPEFAVKEAEKLIKAAKMGAVGIKIFKNLGLHIRNKNGKLIPVDDPALDPIFDMCGKLNLIVAIHTADPVAFFLPVTPENERYDELMQAKGWSFYGEDYPSHNELLAQRDRRIKRHSNTTFLGIHLANYPENIEYVDRLLNENPNLYVDVSARLPEIGRHAANKVKEFFIKHQDRILFGTDIVIKANHLQLGSVSVKEPGFEDADRFYEAHWEFFETDKKQIDHPTPIQGKWKIDAINLPEDVLKKFYHDNAEKLIFKRVITKIE